MITTLLMLSAAQAASPAPAGEPASKREIVREIIVERVKDGETIRLPEGAAPGERRRIVILREGEPRQGSAADTRKKEFRIVRRPGEHRDPAALAAECSGGRKFETEVEGSAAEDGEKNSTRILLCTKGESGADDIQSLERAAKRIAEDKALPDDVRARVIASLNAEIVRRKAGK